MVHRCRVAVPKIWLTRHGQSEYNQLDLLGGDSDISEKGQRYALQLPDVLAARLPAGQSLAVWTSTLTRTVQTARHLPHPQLRWKALDEINAGSRDGLTYAQIAERYPDECKARKEDKLRYRYPGPGGESYEDVVKRVQPVLEALERERQCVVVVAHQAVLRAVYAYFMGAAPEDIPRLSMPLHTLIELTPMPDGSILEERFSVDIDAGTTTEAVAAGAVPRRLAHSCSEAKAEVMAATAVVVNVEAGLVEAAAAPAERPIQA